MSESTHANAQELPDGWSRLPLACLGTFVNGINKSARDFGFGVPFVNLLDVFGIPSITDSPIGLVNATEGELRRYDLHQSDVLFVRSSVKPEGVGLTSVILGSLERTVYSGFLIRFRPEKGRFVRDFLKYCFYDERFRRSLLNKSTVSANTNINQVSLRELQVHMPPCQEQCKIAWILTTLDNLIERTEALIAKYQTIKQGMMHDLFTRGVDRSDHLRPTYDEAPDLYKPSELGWIPKEWYSRALGDVLREAKGFLQTGPFGSQLHAHEYVPEGRAVVMPQDILEGRIVTDQIARVSEVKARSMSRHHVKPNDVVFSRRGDLSSLRRLANRRSDGFAEQGVF